MKVFITGGEDNLGKWSCKWNDEVGFIINE